MPEVTTLIPPRMAALPRDKHHRPVPWFVAFVDGQPDHRLIGPGKTRAAVSGMRCWLCGQRLGPNLAFVIGPMCAVNRVSAEPPSHRDCAIYAARNCPFLTTPQMVRREGRKPVGYVGPAGVMIRRNPGVTLVWITRSFKPIGDAGGYLVEIGKPVNTLWFAEGREATRDEILASINSGLPLLRAEAERDPDPAGALAELGQLHAAALRLLPVPDAPVRLRDEVPIHLRPRPDGKARP